MKKEYLVPEVEVNLVKIEVNILESTFNAGSSSTANMTTNDVDDNSFWSF